ncbi:MAG: hypothetical protein NTW61_03485 [Candidatus Melainabacteria bacterium]|nr:hypothetical protein [Candidatus Melainabacteria bacterium]
MLREAIGLVWFGLVWFGLVWFGVKLAEGNGTPSERPPPPTVVG